MDEVLQLVIKTYGIVGVLILAPVVGVVFVWRSKEVLHGKYVADLKKLSEDYSKAITSMHNDQVTRLVEVHQSQIKLLSDSSDKVVASQALRVADGQAITSKLMEVVSEQSSLNKETNMALGRVGDLMVSLRERS
jgi:hypothetical protein